jgi:uncharacterized Zn-binding protein involved in type VI secretion
MLNPDESPHVGGPIVTGEATVQVGFLPAARLGDMAICIGPPDTIARGSATVLIGYMPAARIGDTTVHGGAIVAGCATVLIGESGSGGFGGANTPCGAAAQQAKDSRAAMRKRKPDEGPSPGAAAPSPPMAPSPFPNAPSLGGATTSKVTWKGGS